MVTTMLGARAVYHLKDICGRNPRFLITLEQAAMVAQNDANVLLLGKIGTGKDIFAQSIHNASSRSDGPYVAINCRAKDGSKSGGFMDKNQVSRSGTNGLNQPGIFAPAAGENHIRRHLLFDRM